VRIAAGRNIRLVASGLEDYPLRIAKGEAITMKRRYYDEENVVSALSVYEGHFELSSSAFYDLYRAGDVPDRVPRSMADSWAGLFEEYEYLRGEQADLAAQVARDLALS
jgi:hypothetical protein